MAQATSTTTASDDKTGSPPAFSQTRWSLVLDLHRPSDERVDRSLHELCECYAFAVYAYVRHSGHAPAAASDLCLAFFAQLPDAVAGLDPRNHGRFRDFLLDRLNAFLASDWHGRSTDTVRQRLSAQLPLDAFEQRLEHDRAACTSPTQAYHRSFALVVIEGSMRRLHSEVMQVGRAGMFEVLRPFLTADPTPGAHEELARQLGISPLTLAVAIRRLCQRFRELADDELAQTTANAEDLERERAAMAALLGGAPT